MVIFQESGEIQRKRNRARSCAVNTLGLRDRGRRVFHMKTNRPKQSDAWDAEDCWIGMHGPANCLWCIAHVGMSKLSDASLSRIDDQSL